METLIHETFNTPLGDTGDVEGHSVIRTENGGVWYADMPDPDEQLVEDHAEIVRRVNRYPALLAALTELLIASECADETGYVADVGFMDIDAIHAKARAAIKDTAQPA